MIITRDLRLLGRCLSLISWPARLRMMAAGLTQPAIIIVLIVQGKRAWRLRLSKRNDCG